MSSDLFEVRSISDVYANPDKTRFTNLAEKFQAKFGAEAEYFVRAPGRVNIIGEHVDYCGFPVLPISIEQDILIAGRVSNDKELRISNVCDTFQEYSCEINSFEITEVKWYSYVLSGYLGIAERMNCIRKGLQLMVDGQVPMSAGLSSSSALVCASALMAAVVLKSTRLTREDIADLCARSERYVGTQGGGMDQAISFLGVKGKAQLINFNPLRCSSVALPDSVVFVVANTMVNKWKADGTDFNNRVAECRLGARVLAQTLGVDWRGIKTYHELMSKQNSTPHKLYENVQKHISPEPYSKQQIMDILKCTECEFADIIGKSNNTDFLLYNRAVHVTSEAVRTAQFHDICTRDAPDVEVLGRLLNESHASLRDKYNVSVDELNELTQICREEGALGSRLVGAGFGGCTISMISKHCVDKFMKGVWERYFKPRDVKYEACVGTYLFASTPCDGACVLGKDL